MNQPTNEATGSTMKLELLAIPLGIICICIGIFVLPWVQFASPEEFAQRTEESATWLQSNGIIESSPRDNFFLDLLTDENLLAQAYDNPDYKPLFETARAGQDLSAWSILRTIPLATITIRWSIMALLLIIPFQLLFLFGYSVLQETNRQFMGYILIALNSALLLILIGCTHAIDNFGVYGELELAMLLYLSKARLGVGFPLTLFGQLISIIGLITILFTSTTGTRRLGAYSSRMRRKR